MKVRRLFQLSSALVLSLGSLLVLSIPAAFAAAPYTCTWTGATNDNFSTAGNWSGCNSAAPQPGDDDNLVFSATSLSQDVTLNNDITGLNLANITFSGTNSGNYSFILTGDAINLGAGITDTSAVSGTVLPTIELDITLTASQTFSVSTTDDLSIDSVNIGSNSLILSNSSTGEILIGAISGSGQLSTDASQPNGFYEITEPSPDFTGPTLVPAGDLGIGDPGALGSGTVTVDDGATLTGIFESKNVTISNPLSIDGNGVNVGGIAGALNFYNDCPSNLSNTSCVNDGIVTLSGPVTLTGNSTVGTDATADFTGTVTGGFSLTIASGFTGTITESPATASSPAAAPNTPDTGLAATVMANPLATAIVTLFTTAALIVIIRRLPSVHVTGRS
jgi:fibronectin-binding autotransporter adhesin